MWLCCGLGASAKKDAEPYLQELIAKNRYYDALKYADSLYRAGVKTADVLFYAGKASEGVLHYKEAYRYYNELWMKDTTHVDAHIAMARVTLLAGKNTEVLRLYEELAKKDSFGVKNN